MQEQTENFYNSENLAKPPPCEDLTTSDAAEQPDALKNSNTTTNSLLKKLNFNSLSSSTKQFEKRKNVANIASNFQAMQVQDTTLDLQKVVERLEQLQLSKM